MCSGDLPSECACVCVAFLLTAHFAFKGHLVIGAARGASCELRLRVCAYLNIRGGGWLPNLDATTDPRCGMEWHAPVAAASSSKHQQQQRGQPVRVVAVACRPTISSTAVIPARSGQRLQRQVHVESSHGSHLHTHAQLLFALLCSDASLESDC